MIVRNYMNNIVFVQEFKFLCRTGLVCKAGQAYLNSWFLNILAASPVEPRFCEHEGMSGQHNCKRISILPGSRKNRYICPGVK